MEALEKFIEVFLRNTNFVFLSVVFGLLGTVLNPKNRTFWAYIISLLTAVVLGIFTGYLLEDMGVKESTGYMIVAVISIIAKDVVEFIIHTAAHINKKSSQIVDFLLKKYLDKNSK